MCSLPILKRILDICRFRSSLLSVETPASRHHDPQLKSLKMFCSVLTIQFPRLIEVWFFNKTCPVWFGEGSLNLRHVQIVVGIISPEPITWTAVYSYNQNIKQVTWSNNPSKERTTRTISSFSGTSTKTIYTKSNRTTLLSRSACVWNIYIFMFTYTVHFPTHEAVFGTNVGKTMPYIMKHPDLSPSLNNRIWGPGAALVRSPSSFPTLSWRMKNGLSSGEP